jgi:hypothetical protein
MKIVVKDILSKDPDIELPEHSLIVFGEGHNAVTVTVHDGEIRVSADGRLAVLPRAANVVWIRKI